MSGLMIGFGGSEPFEVEGSVADLQMVWEPVDGSLPPVPAGTLRLEPVEFSFELSPEAVAWFEGLAAGLPQAREQQAEETRRAWSGPDRLQRRILRAYGVTAGQVGLVSRSVFSSEYRRRQRARVKRRRR